MRLPVCTTAAGAGAARGEREHSASGTAGTGHRTGSRPGATSSLCPPGDTPRMTHGGSGCPGPIACSGPSPTAQVPPGGHHLLGDAGRVWGDPGVPTLLLAVVTLGTSQGLPGLVLEAEERALRLGLGGDGSGARGLWGSLWPPAPGPPAQGSAALAGVLHPLGSPSASPAPENPVPPALCLGFSLAMARGGRAPGSSTRRPVSPAPGRCPQLAGVTAGRGLSGDPRCWGGRSTAVPPAPLRVWWETETSAGLRPARTLRWCRAAARSPGLAAHSQQGPAHACCSRAHSYPAAGPCGCTPLPRPYQ